MKRNKIIIFGLSIFLSSAICGCNSNENNRINDIKDYQYVSNTERIENVNTYTLKKMKLISIRYGVQEEKF